MRQPRATRPAGRTERIRRRRSSASRTRAICTIVVACASSDGPVAGQVQSSTLANASGVPTVPGIVRSGGTAMEDRGRRGRGRDYARLTGAGMSGRVEAGWWAERAQQRDVGHGAPQRVVGGDGPGHRMPPPEKPHGLQPHGWKATRARRRGDSARAQMGDYCWGLTWTWTRTAAAGRTRAMRTGARVTAGCPRAREPHGSRFGTTGSSAVIRHVGAAAAAVTGRTHVCGRYAEAVPGFLRHVFLALGRSPRARGEAPSERPALEPQPREPAETQRRRAE